MRPLRWLIVLWFSLLLAAPALARPADDPTRNFGAALEHYDAGRFGEALPLFQLAYARSQSPNAQLYVARCLAQLGRLVEAHAALRTLSSSPGDDPRYEPTRQQAQKELDQLEARIGRLTIELDATAAGARVSRNGESVRAEQLGLPLVVAPGPQRVVAKTNDGRESAIVVDVNAGQSRSIELSFDPPERTTPAQPAPSPDRAAPEPTGLSALQFTGIAAMVAGAGGIVVFGVLYDQALTTFDEIEAECGGRCVDPSYGSEIDDGKALETGAFVGLGIGGAALLAGTAMLIFGGDDPPVEAALGIDPGGGSLVLRRRFW